MAVIICSRHYFCLCMTFFACQKYIQRSLSVKGRGASLLFFVCCRVRQTYVYICLSDSFDMQTAEVGGIFCRLEFIEE